MGCVSALCSDVPAVTLVLGMLSWSGMYMSGRSLGRCMEWWECTVPMMCV